MKRCGWCEKDELYTRYHDEEWGVPVFDDRKQFEFLVLESAQAGLSWLTILRKRENYRAAYDGFDPQKVALYDENKIAELMANKGIVRNRLKIAASITNAASFLVVQKEFGSFANYIWSFTGGKVITNGIKTLADIPARSELSDRIASDMKKRGFRFLGSVIIYSHLQATGLINDHLTDCFRYDEISAAAKDIPPARD
ncbi:MAG: DNA-3-methyladenine glycosylase I [Helicobacteraceae bacterium]|jgi:DNA-3-methyladenine glycosylase I|nr:DNA-3-methyladenine glycosylase I [Helicobacteraceae bacterium]